MEMGRVFPTRLPAPGGQRRQRRTGAGAHTAFGGPSAERALLGSQALPPTNACPSLCLHFPPNPLLHCGAGEPMSEGEAEMVRERERRTAVHPKRPKL